VAGVTGNLHYAVATQRIQSQLMQGQSLTHALEQHASLFQPMLIQMCAIGEESGTLDDMLDKAAHHFETSVTRAVAQLFCFGRTFLDGVARPVGGWHGHGFVLAHFSDGTSDMNELLFFVLGAVCSWPLHYLAIKLPADILETPVSSRYTLTSLSPHLIDIF